jgi:hypothetical protein
VEIKHVVIYYQITLWIELLIVICSPCKKKLMGYAIPRLLSTHSILKKQKAKKYKNKAGCQGPLFVRAGRVRFRVSRKGDFY